MLNDVGTDHSQNPSAIIYIKSPKEKINCADRVYICESRNCVDERVEVMFLCTVASNL